MDKTLEAKVGIQGEFVVIPLEAWDDLCVKMSGRHIKTIVARGWISYAMRFFGVSFTEMEAMTHAARDRHTARVQAREKEGVEA